MKKKIVLLFFAFLSFFSLQAQDTIYVGGYVTNLNGHAIPNHTMYILSDSIGIIYSYSNTTTTSANGYYTFSIPNVLSGTLVNYHIYTFDCNNQIHYSTFTNANPQTTINFSFCDSPSSACNANFLHYTSTTNNYTINFLDSSSGTPVSWFWSFGDGNFSTAQNPTHSYNGNGPFNVCLTITTANNCSSTFCDTIYIQGSTNTCNANFTYYADTITSLNTILFFNTSTSSYGNYQIEYLWNFGDGTTSSLQNPVHTFQPNPANNNGYNVCLTTNVLDSNNNVVCLSSHCQFVYIIPSINNCQNVFTYIHQNLTYTFTGHINSNYPTTYKWIFGDGTTATGQYVTHTFMQPSPSINGYNVCLITTTSNGSGTACIDTSCQFITINNVNGTVLQGVVYAGNYPVTNGYILIYQANNATMSYNLVDTIVLDTIGYYQYNHMDTLSANSAFLIKAVLNPSSPNYNQFAPTFYMNSVNWVTASPVFLSSNTAYYNINMVQLPQTTSGNGTISGNVNQTLTKSMNVNPFPGAELILTDENNTPLKIKYSDANGNFSFNGLPMGNYKLYLEITGISCTPYPVSLTGTNPEANNISVTVNNTEAAFTGVDEIKSNNISISEIYPNPAADEAFINIQNSGTDKVRISVYSQTGIKISSNEYIVNGSQYIAIDNKQLPSGVYFVKIENSKGLNNMRKLVVSH